MDYREKITDIEMLLQNYCYRDGFIFTSISEPANVYDAILIRNPEKCETISPKLGFSSKSLEEHITYINRYQIHKAIIICENLDFIAKCPSLEYLKIIPVNNNKSTFDFSPLYRLKRVLGFDCETFGKIEFTESSVIDCSKLVGLEKLWVRSEAVVNYKKIDSLKELYLYGCKNFDDLQSISENANLRKLSCIQCDFRSLKGIENLKKLQWFDISYSRRLDSVGMLPEIHESLRLLHIERCPKITEFSWLSCLERVEYLNLIGDNIIPDLRFIPAMQNLKMFLCTMNIEDGNISPCLRVPYVDIKNRRHYNLKNASLGKKIE